MRCLLCQNEVQEWQEYGTPARRGKCPHCESKPRHRELAWFFERFLQFPIGAKVLEVGPSKVMTAQFLSPRFLGEAKYTAIDTRALKHHSNIRPPHRFMSMDVTRLSFSDRCFDVILCNNVLPYIRSDYMAISEVHRCLKDQGFAMLNTAYPIEKTKRASELRQSAPDVYTEDYFHENGTEWVYGADFFERVEAAGFFHSRLNISELAGPKLSSEQYFQPADEFIFCFRLKHVMEQFLEKLR